MKIWGVLCLFGSISGLNAHAVKEVDNADNSEERIIGVGFTTHLDEESNKETSSGDHKADNSSIVKESNESVTSPKEETPETYVIIVNDKPSPPGGGVPLLDPKVAGEMPLPPFPEAPDPWWERCWHSISAWFSGEDS